jgi:hypothetical protein
VNSGKAAAKSERIIVFAAKAEALYILKKEKENLLVAARLNKTETRRTDKSRRDSSRS